MFVYGDEKGVRIYVYVAEKAVRIYVYNEMCKNVYLWF